MHKTFYAFLFLCLSCAVCCKNVSTHSQTQTFLLFSPHFKNHIYKFFLSFLVHNLQRINGLWWNIVCFARSMSSDDVKQFDYGAHWQLNNIFYLKFADFRYFSGILKGLIQTHSFSYLQISYQLFNLWAYIVSHKLFQFVTFCKLVKVVHFHFFKYQNVPFCFLFWKIDTNDELIDNDFSGMHVSGCTYIKYMQAISHIKNEMHTLVYTINDLHTMIKAKTSENNRVRILLHFDWMKVTFRLTNFHSFFIQRNTFSLSFNSANAWNLVTWKKLWAKNSLTMQRKHTEICFYSLSILRIF